MTKLQKKQINAKIKALDRLAGMFEVKDTILLEKCDYTKYINKKFGTLTISCNVDEPYTIGKYDTMTVTVTNSSFNDTGKYEPEDSGVWEIFEFIPLDGTVITKTILNSSDKELCSYYARLLNGITGGSYYGIRPYITKSVTQRNGINNRHEYNWFETFCDRVIPDSWA